MQKPGHQKTRGCTVHLHPSAMNPHVITELNQTFGLIAVIRRNDVVLLPQAIKRRPAMFRRSTDYPTGPEAA